MKILLLIPVLKPEIAAGLSSSSESLETLVFQDYPFETFYMNQVRENIYKLEPNEIKEFLSKCIQSVVQVDYNRIIFILELLAETNFNVQSLDLLKFLSEYTRNKQPSVKETSLLLEEADFIPENVKKIYQIMNRKVISLESYYKFYKEIMENELCLANLESFLKFGEFKKLDYDEMHAIAIESSFKHLHSGSKCNLCPKFSEIRKFVGDFRDYLKKVDFLEKISSYCNADQNTTIRNTQLSILKQQKDIIGRIGIKSSNQEKIEMLLEVYSKKKIKDQIRLELLKNEIEGNFDLYYDKPFDLIKQIYAEYIPLILSNKINLSKPQLFAIIKNICGIYDQNLSDIHQKIFKD